jgi:hypothetical protein
VSESHLIEIRIEKLDELLDPRDPSVDPSLDPYVSEFVVSWAREIPTDESFAIKVWVAEQVTPERAARAEQAMRTYYAYEAGIEERKLHALWREGRISLAIGLVFLAVATLGAQAITAEEGTWSIIREGIIVFGLVAMWKPVNLYMYDWWPIRSEIRMFHRLESAPVEVVGT